jgi:hypothetical protein
MMPKLNKSTTFGILVFSSDIQFFTLQKRDAMQTYMQNEFHWHIPLDLGDIILQLYLPLISEAAFT